MNPKLSKLSNICAIMGHNLLNWPDYLITNGFIDENEKEKLHVLIVKWHEKISTKSSLFILIVELVFKKLEKGNDYFREV